MHVFKANDASPSNSRERTSTSRFNTGAVNTGSKYKRAKSLTDSLMDEFERRMDRDGVKLPAHPSRPNRIWWNALAEMAGVTSTLLKAKHLRYRARAEGWLGRFGLEVQQPPQDGRIPIGEFAEIWRLQRQHELETSPLDEQSKSAVVANMQNALDFVASIKSRPADARICLNLAMATESLDSAVRDELVLCLQRLNNWTENRNLPEDPIALLRFGIARSGYSMQMIEHFTGVPAWSMAHWRSRGYRPVPARYHLLTPLEIFLRLPENSLIERFRKLRRSERKPPKRGRSPYGKAVQQLQTQPYVMHEWPQEPEDEFTRWYHYRTDNLLPYGMDRKGRPWREKTVLNTRDYISMVFGTWCSEYNTKMQMLPEDMSLAYFVFPELIHIRLDFAIQRMKASRGIERGFMTKWEYAQLGFLRSWLDEQYGWLTQMPELADRLKPVLGRNGREIVSAAQIAEVRRDWRKACADARNGYGKLMKSHKEYVKTSRNPHQDIKPILNMANPFDAFKMLCVGVRGELKGFDLETKPYAYTARDIVIAGIMTQCAFRVSTLSELDIDYLSYDENTGVWWLRVPRHHFKNAYGPYFGSEEKGFREFYERELDDRYGLYDAIAQYMSWGRAMIVGTANTRALLVCEVHEKNGVRAQQDNCEPGRATTDYLRKLLHALTARYVGYNADARTGIEGIVSFGPHAFRHILATGMLKRSKSKNREQEAADAIHDGKSSIAQYTQYLPEDRLEPMMETMRAGFADATGHSLAA